MKLLNPKYLPYFGAVVQAILFSIAGNEYFPAFGWLVGLGVGAVVNYSVALASSRISDIAKSRKPLAYLSLVLLFALSPVIICSTLGWSMATFSWSVACDLSIILAGAISGKSLLPAEQVAQPKRKKPQVVATATQEDVKPAKVARKTVAETELLAYLQGNAGASQSQVAEYFGVTRQAIGSRMKKIYAVKGE